MSEFVFIPISTGPSTGGDLSKLFVFFFFFMLFIVIVISIVAGVQLSINSSNNGCSTTGCCGTATP